MAENILLKDYVEGIKSEIKVTRKRMLIRRNEPTLDPAFFFFLSFFLYAGVELPSYQESGVCRPVRQVVPELQPVSQGRYALPLFVLQAAHFSF